MKSCFSFLLSVAISVVCFAQVKNYYINPDSTFPGISNIHTGHFITVDMSHPFSRKLLISIPGTTGPGDVMKPFDSVAALEGYHAISLDYPNDRNTATFTNSPDKQAFNKFRQELNFGTAVSDSVNVDSLNCIVNRITRLIAYLAKTRPQEGWNNFLDHGDVIWDRVTLAGHSQGAGHVSYIAHVYKVHKVIMLSGPQDFLIQYNMPAPWLSEPSQTPLPNYYAFLREKDAYNTHRQIRDALAVMHADSSTIYRFQTLGRFPKDCRILVSEIPIPQSPAENAGYLNHMSTLMPMHGQVWIWLLNH